MDSAGFSLLDQRPKKQEQKHPCKGGRLTSCPGPCVKENTSHVCNQSSIRDGHPPTRHSNECLPCAKCPAHTPKTAAVIFLKKTSSSFMKHCRPPSNAPPWHTHSTSHRLRSHPMRFRELEDRSTSFSPWRMMTMYPAAPSVAGGAARPGGRSSSRWGPGLTWPKNRLGPRGLARHRRFGWRTTPEPPPREEHDPGVAVTLGAPLPQSCCQAPGQNVHQNG